MNKLDRTRAISIVNVFDGQMIELPNLEDGVNETTCMVQFDSTVTCSPEVYRNESLWRASYKSLSRRIKWLQSHVKKLKVSGERTPTRGMRRRTARTSLRGMSHHFLRTFSRILITTVRISPDDENIALCRISMNATQSLPSSDTFSTHIIFNGFRLLRSPSMRDLLCMFVFVSYVLSSIGRKSNII